MSHKFDFTINGDEAILLQKKPFLSPNAKLIRRDSEPGQKKEIYSDKGYYVLILNDIAFDTFTTFPEVELAFLNRGGS